MIEVLGFYAKGAQVVRATHEFNPSTFAVEKTLHELGHSPSSNAKKTRKPKAHLLRIDGDPVLILNAGHDYVIKHVSKERKDLVVSAKDEHKIVPVEGKLKKVLSGENEVEVIS